MTPQEQGERIIKALAQTAEMVGAKRSPEALAMMAKVVLQALTYKEATAALARHVQTNHRMPTPADLITIIKGTPEDRAEKALDEVHRAVKEVGSYKTPSFTDPATSHAVSAMGGWVEFCGQPDTTFKNAAFKKAYLAFQNESRPVELRSLHGGKQQVRLSESREPKRLGEVLEER